jgi:hypothetical protein
MCKKEKIQKHAHPTTTKNLTLKVNETNCVKYVNEYEKYIYSDFL